MEAHDGNEDVIAELLALPPEEFTEARNAAAKRLRGEGRRAAADEIKGLPRPSVPLWALNGLAREQPELVEGFLTAAGALREAYRSGGDIRAATAPERAAEARVAAAAATLARAGGKNVSDAVVQSVGRILHAAAADADVAAALRSGLLIREPEAPSLDQLLGSLPPVRARARAGAKEGRAEPAAAEESPKRDLGAERTALRKQIASATSAAKAARDEARAAADAERAARTDWERAQELAQAARAQSEAGAEAVADLERQLAEL